MIIEKCKESGTNAMRLSVNQVAYKRMHMTVWGMYKTYTSVTDIFRHSLVKTI